MALEDALEELRGELASVGERLADLAIDQLREGLRGGEAAAQAAKQTEKRITRARRSVEKAAMLLSSSGFVRDDEL